VGKTNNLTRRFQSHLDDNSNNLKTAWIKSLKKQGLKPSFQVIDIATELDWKTKECYWIGMFPNLKNMQSGGSYGNKVGTGKGISKGVGSKNPKAQLNENQVLEIINLYKYTNLDSNELAKLYNVGKRSIQKIIAGETWEHLNNQGKIVSLFNKHKYKQKLKLQGENHYNSVLKTQDVIIIKNMLNDGLLQKDIAKKFNVSAGIIGKIYRKETWFNVTI
jgi:predicted DNA-binding protein YlxM (UPF0122 family)